MDYIRTLKNLLKDALNGDHYSDFDTEEIKEATRRYVPQQIQRLIWINGTNYTEEEIEIRDIIDFFQKTCFNKNSPLARFSIIFAGPGVGKTTFLQNLFHACTTRMNSRKRKYGLKLFSLAHPSTLEMVSQIENKQETVLLLDGFDEDARSIINFRDRFREIYDLSKGFAKVVMTSRKRLFSFSESQTFEQYILSDDDDKEGIELCCTFLHEMNIQEIARYVAQSYSHKDRQKRRKVSAFIKRTELLIDQPVLLSYIEDLMAHNIEYSFVSEIYEALIENWIEREELFFNSSQKQWSSEEERKAFYRALSLAIHQKQREGGGLTLNKKEFTEIGQNHSLDIQAFESNPNSLIRYSQDKEEYKFTHRTIWEYFLAKEAIDSSDFLATRPFYGRDKTLDFFQNMTLSLSMVKVGSGIHQVESGEEYREVNIDTFYIDKYPVKVSAFRSFCEDTGIEMPNPPSWGWEEEAPIINVSWIDAMNYCRWLSKLTGLSYRLPTSAEWEYAALGGNKSSVASKYAGGNLLDSLGWFIKNSERRTHPVGEKSPNQIGIYDLCGNVWEWCLPEENGPEEVEYGVIKGGSWMNDESAFQISNQGKLAIDSKKNMLGFRVVVSG